MLRVVLQFLAATVMLGLVGGYLARALPGTGAVTRFAEPLGWSSAGASKSAPNPAGERVLVVNADLMGHYTLHPTVEGRRTTMLVDTGSTLVALTSEDAFAAGFRPLASDFNRQVSTANGVVAVAPVCIREMTIGDIVVRNVDAVVLPRGVLDQSLLGMSFLRGLSGFEMSRGRLTLRG